MNIDCLFFALPLQPPTSLLKDIAKLKHPNSRRTKALAKKAKRYNNRDKIKLGHAIKSNILGDKFGWFTEQLDDDSTDRLRLTPTEFSNLIELCVYELFHSCCFYSFD